MTAKIKFQEVTKRFDNADVSAVADLSFEIEEGAFVAVLGSSGSGKTTALKLINRLIEPSSGSIFIDGNDSAKVDPVLLRRSIGYVIQDVGLFPHMSVAANIATVPKILKWPREKTAQRVDELLAMVNLDPDIFRNRRPAQLSGGQRQRVGLARAMAADPSVLLMDEPFGAVDAINRVALQDELLNLYRRSQKTIFFVTHDVEEAFKLATKVLIMDAGHLQQYATPPEIIARPANAFVADLTRRGTRCAVCDACEERRDV